MSSNYSIKDEGISPICEAIQSNKETKLASLNFMDNDVGPVGAKSVAAMVAVTGALTRRFSEEPPDGKVEMLEHMWERIQSFLDASEGIA